MTDLFEDFFKSVKESQKPIYPSFLHIMNQKQADINESLLKYLKEKEARDTEAELKNRKLIIYTLITSAISLLIGLLSLIAMLYK